MQSDEAHDVIYGRNVIYAGRGGRAGKCRVYLSPLAGRGTAGDAVRTRASSMRSSVIYAALRYAAAAVAGTAQSRLIASTIAVGFATPLPAMSNALPCATEENRIGVPMARPAVAF
jgi:hypothetical protein